MEKIHGKKAAIFFTKKVFYTLSRNASIILDIFLQEWSTIPLTNSRITNLEIVTQKTKITMAKTIFQKTK